MATNIKTVSEVEQINRIRQHKIIKGITDKDVSVLKVVYYRCFYLFILIS